MPLRIGFAYNQKPDEDGGTTDEPPSSRPPSGESDDRFAEWDDAATIDAVEAALERAGVVIRLEADLDFPQKLRDANPDIVFNIAEGLNGRNREAHVPAICEFYDIPFTASDASTLSIALDKARAKEVFLARGVATPAWTISSDGSDFDQLWERGAGQWIVKPLYEGSSKGIPQRALCESRDDVARQVEEIRRAYHQPALVEEFMPGREFTASIVGNGAGARILPLVEIRFDALPIGAAPLYGYEAKWVWDTKDNPLRIFECPASLDERLAERIEDVSLAAYHALGCRDWSRIDLRLDAAGMPHVLEINPLPGILPDPAQNSCFPKAARAAGLDYEDLILCVLDVGLARYGMTR